MGKLLKRIGKAAVTVIRERLTLRHCQEADLLAVLRIERQAFGVDAWPADAFEGCVGDGAASFLVATRGGRVCGYSLAYLGRGGAELYSLAVARRERGRGVGRALLRRAMVAAWRLGARRMWLTVRSENGVARGLYEATGFRRTRLVLGYYEDGSDGVRMRIELG